MFVFALKSIRSCMVNYLLKVNHCKLFGKLFVEGQGAVARCGEGMK